MKNPIVDLAAIDSVVIHDIDAAHGICPYSLEIRSLRIRANPAILAIQASDLC